MSFKEFFMGLFSPDEDYIIAEDESKNETKDEPLTKKSFLKKDFGEKHEDENMNSETEKVKEETVDDAVGDISKEVTEETSELIKEDIDTDALAIDKLEELYMSDAERLQKQISVVESVPIPEAVCDVCGNGSTHREFEMPVTYSKWSDTYMKDGGFMIYSDVRKVCLCDDCVSTILRDSGRLIETYIGKDGDKGKYGLVISKSIAPWLVNK